LLIAGCDVPSEIAARETLNPSRAMLQRYSAVAEASYVARTDG
jgi:hypothetical protein